MSESFKKSSVRTRRDFIVLLRTILDEENFSSWKNKRTHCFLEALSAWLDDADWFYANSGEATKPDQISWQLLADAIQAALVYE